MNHIFKLGWRSIWRNRRRTIITLSSMTLGLVLAVFFIAMAEGVYEKMTDDAVRMLGGHITLEHPEYRDAPAVDLTVPEVDRYRKDLEAIPAVESTKVLVLGQGVLKSGGGAVGITLIGVEPATEKLTSPMARKIVAGSYLKDDDTRKVLIGSQLARQLKLGKERDIKRIVSFWQSLFSVFDLPMDDSIAELARLHLAIGKKVVITSTNVDGDLVEELVRVRGIFKMGAPEMDGYLIQVPIDLARKVYGLGKNDVTQLGVVLKSADDQEVVLAAARRLTQGQPVTVLPWEDVLPDLAAYIRIDGGSNIIFQGIILFLIMFTIFNSILMSVLERTREFAVLLAIGTPPKVLRLQVMVETALIGLLGCVLGLGLGSLLAYFFQVNGMDLRGMMPEGSTVSGFAFDLIIYPKLSFEMLAWVGGLVFGAIMILGLYPMRKATRMPLADLLR